MNKQRRRCANPNTDSSRVLLVCIYDTFTVDITNEMLYASFMGHGRIDKLLVFEKGQITKAFVQFATIPDAQKAKNELDGTKLIDTFCKVHLFYSNLKEVDLNNRMFSRGKDYSSCSSDMAQPHQTFSPNGDHFNNVVRTKRKTSDDFDLEPHDHFSLENFGRFSRTDNKSHLNAIEAFRLQDPEAEEHCLSNIEQRIRWDIEKIMIDDEDQITKEELTPLNQQLQTAELVNTPVVEQDPLCNWILCFNYEHKLRPMEVYNLFSNFGDINKIIVRKSIVVIEFMTPQFAAIACDNLNKSVFYGNTLEISYGTASILQEKQRQYAQSVSFDESYYRFTTHKSLSINQPSITLHVSNLKRQVCTIDRLNEIFCEAGHVDKVSILGSGKERSMALIRMATLEESFAAVGLLHNRIIQGRKLQISFTKSRI